jgi:hypothetical protein
MNVLRVYLRRPKNYYAYTAFLSTSPTPTLTFTASMRLATSLLCGLSLTVILCGYPSLGRRVDPQFKHTCHQIAAVVSKASEVYFPRMSSGLSCDSPSSTGDQATAQYLSDISHNFVSSSEESACSVEPGSAEDVSKIVRQCPSVLLILISLIVISSCVSWDLLAHLLQSKVEEIPRIRDSLRREASRFQ